MLGGLSGQDLTIIADPADRLLVSNKHIVSTVIIGLRPEINQPQSPFALEALTMLEMSVG